MENEQQVRTLILRVLNVAETGDPDGKPHAVYIYADGKNGRKQVTLGVGFTEDGGNLEKVLKRYIAKKGAFAGELSTHLPQIGKGTLAANKAFHQLLKKAGQSDPLMAEAQNEEFSKAYLEPAFKWFTKNGFTLPLSLLVIADSYLHSGGIREALRKSFRENPPAQGGDEKAWIRSYVEARHNWLSNHSNKLLRNTVYRTQSFRDEIARDNWMLDRLPINMNGVAVYLPTNGGGKYPAASSTLTMNKSDKIKAIQRAVGVKDDGVLGSMTIDAVYNKIVPTVAPMIGTAPFPRN